MHSSEVCSSSDPLKYTEIDLTKDDIIYYLGNIKKEKKLDEFFKYVVEIMIINLKLLHFISHHPMKFLSIIF
jgi:hypothetical protein